MLESQNGFLPLSHDDGEEMTDEEMAYEVNSVNPPDTHTHTHTHTHIQSVLPVLTAPRIQELR